MSVKERIKKYLKSKKLSARRFSLSIGMSENYITSMKNSLQPDVIDKIAVCYPDLNIGWLMAEDGDMLKQTKIYPLPNVDQLANVKDKGKPCERCAENNATINSLNNYIKKLEKEINDLGGNLNLVHPLNKTGSGSP